MQFRLHLCSWSCKICWWEQGWRTEAVSCWGRSPAAPPSRLGGVGTAAALDLSPVPLNCCWTWREACCRFVYPWHQFSILNHKIYHPAQLQVRVRSAPLHLVRIECLAQGLLNPRAWVRLFQLKNSLKSQGNAAAHLNITRARVPLVSKWILTIFISWHQQAQLITLTLKSAVPLQPCHGFCPLCSWSDDSRNCML